MIINLVAYVIFILLRIYIWVLMLRLLLQLVHADYFNPLPRIVMRFTRFPLKFFKRRYCWHVELWPVVFMLIVEVLKLGLAKYFYAPHFGVLDYALVGVMSLVRQLVNLYFYIFIIAAIASWVAIKPHPVILALNQLTAPLLRPLQRYIPSIKGIDFTPLIWIIALQCVDTYFLAQFSIGF